MYTLFATAIKTLWNQIWVCGTILTLWKFLPHHYMML